MADRPYREMRGSRQPPCKANVRPSIKRTVRHLRPEIVEGLTTNSACALLASALGLVGLSSFSPVQVGPMTSLILALIGLTLGVYAMRSPAESRPLVALSALSLGLIALIASAVVLMSVGPCGTKCW